MAHESFVIPLFLRGQYDLDVQLVAAHVLIQTCSIFYIEVPHMNLEEVTLSLIK